MKHRLFSVFTALTITVSAFAQIPAEEFQKAKAVWYGLDFTKAKMIGSEGFTDPQAIQRDYFQKWNGLIVTEADKYDIKGAFKKDNNRYKPRPSKRIEREGRCKLFSNK